jgi:hypothetical protein
MRLLFRVLVVMTVLLVTTTGRSSTVNESWSCVGESPSAVDESLPPGFGITYTKPPPHSPDLPMPYLVTPEHDPAKGGDPAYKWMHFALWRVGSSDLEEFAADVRGVLSAQREEGGVDGLWVTTGRCYVYDPYHPEVEYPIPVDTFRRVFEVWYRAKAKFRDDQIVKFGKAEW